MSELGRMAAGTSIVAQRVKLLPVMTASYADARVQAVPIPIKLPAEAPEKAWPKFLGTCPPHWET